MAHADIYPTRWVSPTVGLTVVMVQRRLQALLDANRVVRRVKVEARVITDPYGDHGIPLTAYLAPETNWADVGTDVHFRYSLDGQLIGSSTHEYEWRLDYIYPVEERPRWFNTPQAHGVTPEQLATIQKIPYGWCSDVADNAEPFVVAGFGITISVLAEHVDGVVEFLDAGHVPNQVYSNSRDLETVWVQNQIDAARPGELDPTIYWARVLREKELDRELRDQAWEDERADSGSDPSKIRARFNARLERARWLSQWKLEQTMEEIRIRRAITRGLPPGSSDGR